MSKASLLVRQAGPALSVQDLGRPGFLLRGLSRGGVADWRGFVEGAALLGQGLDCGALEMAGMGGVFEATSPMIVALTGAPMTARCNGDPVRWNTAFALNSGDLLEIGAAQAGIYGYLHVAGGIDTPQILGSRSVHLTGGLGAVSVAGDSLPIGDAPSAARPGYGLAVPERFSGGELRVVETAQTSLFTAETQTRLQATAFRRDIRGNRQGIRLDFDGEGFMGAGQLSILSDVIMPGDIQMTGEGTPFILMPECQTTGGYPRIGSVVPGDLPIAAQATPGTPLRFRFVSRATALAGHETTQSYLARCRSQCAPVLRDPHDIADLLSYQLVGGAINANDPDPKGELP